MWNSNMHCSRNLQQKENLGSPIEQQIYIPPRTFFTQGFIYWKSSILDVKVKVQGPLFFEQNMSYERCKNLLYFISFNVRLSWVQQVFKSRFCLIFLDWSHNNLHFVLVTKSISVNSLSKRQTSLIKSWCITGKPLTLKRYA